jgi:hypothetical protein
VFRATASGAKTDRSQLCKALEQIDADDVLMVTRLDRLARSTRDLLNTLATVTHRKAGFRSLGDTWADTTSPHGRLNADCAGRASRVPTVSSPSRHLARAGYRNNAVARPTARSGAFVRSFER